MAASSDPRSSSSAGAHDAARTAATGATTGGTTAGTTAGAAPPTGGDAGTGATGTAGAITGMEAGAVAGAMTFGFGALAGVALGAAAGAALGDDVQPRGQFSAEADAYFRALYEGSPERGRSYEQVRPAYVFGFVAASEPGLAGLTFEQAEPALREAWTDEFRARAGDWAGVRQYVDDAYGHTRAEGVGERRVRGVIGSAGSAVDPVELDRARHGLSSVPGVVDWPGAAGTPGADAA